MQLGDELRSTLEEWSSADSVNGLGQQIPDHVIREALTAVKEPSQRRRALPSDVVMWLVIGMSLLRDRCIRAVATELGLRGDGGEVLSNSAIIQARDRVGEKAVRVLFDYSAKHWALEAARRDCFFGLALFGADGSCLRVADSTDNEAYFGRPSAGSKRGQSGYPQARVVALMSLRSRLLLGAQIGAYTTHEQILAKDLWALLPERSLVVLDRGFIDYGLFCDIAACAGQRHFLCRAKANIKYKLIEQLSPDDMLIEIKAPRQRKNARAEQPDVLKLRLIRYQRKGFPPQLLLTSLTDHKLYSSESIAQLYHERWELELGYDEIKTHTLEREESLRSKTPERVRQEIWGLLVAYNLVRRHILRFAEQERITPLRVSYKASLLLVRSTLFSAAHGIGSTKKLLAAMHEQTKLLILPERRNRRYARAVKIKMSPYSRNARRGSTRLEP